MYDIFDTLGIERPAGMVAFEPRVVTGTIKATNADAALVEFTTPEGKTGTGILPITETLRSRSWAVGSEHLLLQCDGSKRPMLSAVRPGLVEAVLGGICPEVRDGRVRVMGVARRPGARTKIAVAPTTPTVDAVAACVGRRHNRVDSIKEALGGEQVDIIAWHPDPHIYLQNAMQPAKIDKVAIDPTTRSAVVQAPSHQMAAAVGGNGLNSVLAGRLLGVTVRVVS